MEKMIRVGIFVLLALGVSATGIAQDYRSEVELEQKIAQLENELAEVRQNSDGYRRAELKERLEELRQVDKRELTANEKKELRREKRAINNELEQIDGVNQNGFYDPWLYPYAGFGRFGRFNRFNRFNRFYGHPAGFRVRRVYRRPVCVVRPTRTTS